MRFGQNLGWALVVDYCVDVKSLPLRSFSTPFFITKILIEIIATTQSYQTEF